MPGFPFAFGDDRWPGISKLCEEAGEMVQVIGKLWRVGGRIKHWDDAEKGPLHERLEKEMGDTLAAILFVTEQCVLISPKRVFERAAQKLQLFRTWHKDEEGFMRAPVSTEAFSTLLRATTATRCKAWSYPGHASWEAKLNKPDGRQCALDSGHKEGHELSGPWTALQ